MANLEKGFELHVTVSGIGYLSPQMKTPLPHLAGPKVRDIFNKSIPVDQRGKAKDFKKAMDSLSN